LEKLDAFQEGIKNDAKNNRQELNSSLKSFEEKSALAIKQLSEQLQVQLALLHKST
jgi:DNA recombination protein RmuC